MANQIRLSLGAVKATIARFAAGQESVPQATREREFGDLLLYLIRLAEQCGVDLIAASEQRVAEKASRMPKAAN
jgi:NTP pyrophosphatase (non-canonical NTP hydrolase)